MLKRESIQMKNKLSTGLLYLTALMLLLFSSCKKEIILAPKSTSSKMKTGKGEKIENIPYAQFLTSVDIAKTGALRQSLLSKPSKSTSTSGSAGLELDMGNVKKLIAKGKTSYVISIKPETPHAIAFRNITIQETDGQTIAFMTTYIPTRKWISEWQKGVQLDSVFRGETYSQKINLTELPKLNNSAGTMGMGPNSPSTVLINGNKISLAPGECETYDIYITVNFACAEGHVTRDVCNYFDSHGTWEEIDGDWPPYSVVMWAGMSTYCEPGGSGSGSGGGGSGSGGGTTPNPPNPYDPCDPKEPSIQSSIKKNGAGFLNVPPPPCDGSGGGGGSNSATVLINDLQITDESQQAYLSSNTSDADALRNYLTTNGWTSGNMEFIYWSIAYLTANPSEEVANLLANRASIYYTNAEMEAIFDSIEEDLTADPVEFYLILEYRNPKYFDLYRYDTSTTTMIGGYYVTPYRNKAGAIVCYTAARGGYNGIEYVIKAGQLSTFSANVNNYLEAADNFYSQGKPSLGQVQYAAGDRWKGLGNMWLDAIKSPTWWAYATTSFGHAITRLPNSSVGSTSIAPKWRISMKKMTGDIFQGRVVTNTYTGNKVTINIPDDYIVSLSDNGKGLNFRPSTPINPLYPDAGLIRIMAPTAQFPNGYARFYNNFGQPMDNPSVNMNPGSNNNSHFSF